MIKITGRFYVIYMDVGNAVFAGAKNLPPCDKGPEANVLLTYLLILPGLSVNKRRFNFSHLKNIAHCFDLNTPLKIALNALSITQ
jgi:hypothetical protein